MVWGDGGVKAVGMEMGPMSVDRVVSAQVGSSGSERRDRACLPISIDDDGEESCDSNALRVFYSSGVEKFKIVISKYLNFLYFST